MLLLATAWRHPGRDPREDPWPTQTDGRTETSSGRSEGLWRRHSLRRIRVHSPVVVKSTTCTVINYIPFCWSGDSFSQSSSSRNSDTPCWLILCPLFRTQPSVRCRNVRRRSATWFALSRECSRRWQSWSLPTREQHSTMLMDIWSVWPTRLPTLRGETRRSRSCHALKITSTLFKWANTCTRHKKVLCKRAIY